MPINATDIQWDDKPTLSEDQVQWDNEPAPVVPSGLLSAFKEGLKRSTAGTALTGYHPEEVAPSGTAQRLAVSSGRIVGDIPAMAAGGLVGGLAGPASGMAGMFAAPAAISEAQKQAGEGVSFAPAADVMFNPGAGPFERAAASGPMMPIQKEAGKAAVTGLATYGAGKIAAPIVKAVGATPLGQSIAKGAAEIGAMTATPAALEGRTPTGQEWLDNVLLLGAMHGVNAGLKAVFKPKAANTDQLITTLKDGLDTGKITIKQVKQARGQIPDTHPQASVLDTIIKEHDKPVMESVRMGMEATAMPKNATVMGEDFTTRAVPETQRRTYVDRRQNRQTNNLPAIREPEENYTAGREEPMPQVETVISRHQTEAQATKKMGIERRKNPGMDFRIEQRGSRFTVLGSERPVEAVQPEVLTPQPITEPQQTLALTGPKAQEVPLLAGPEQPVAALPKPQGFVMTDVPPETRLRKQPQSTGTMQGSPIVVTQPMLSANGKPYVTLKSAEKSMKAKGLDANTHEVIPYENGFAIREQPRILEEQKTPAQSETTKKEAERLGVTYDGYQPGVGDSFTDPVTKSTFQVKTGESIEAKLADLRSKSAPEKPQVETEGMETPGGAKEAQGEGVVQENVLKSGTEPANIPPVSSDKGPGENTTGATPQPDGGIKLEDGRSLPDGYYVKYENDWGSKAWKVYTPDDELVGYDKSNKEWALNQAWQRVASGNIPNPKYKKLSSFNELSESDLRDLLNKNGLFYRVHGKNEKFHKDLAYSSIIDGSNKRKGYSSYDNASELVDYWNGNNPSNRNISDDADIVIYSGKKVGKGGDGEPLSVPDMKSVYRTTWKKLLSAIEPNPNQSRPSEVGGKSSTIRKAEGGNREVAPIETAKTVQEKPKSEQPQNGWAYIKGQQKPFIEYREIKSGRDKGMLAIRLPNGKEVKVDRKDVVRMPEEKPIDNAVASAKIDLDARREEAREAIKEDHPNRTAPEIERGVEKTVRSGVQAGVSARKEERGRGRESEVKAEAVNAEPQPIEPVAAEIKPETQPKSKPVRTSTTTAKGHFPARYTKPIGSVMGKLFRIVDSAGNSFDEWITDAKFAIKNNGKISTAKLKYNAPNEARELKWKDVKKQLLGRSLKDYVEATDITTRDYDEYSDATLSGNGKEIVANPHYIGLVKQIYPQAKFLIRGEREPIFIKNGKEIVSVLMPISGASKEDANVTMSFPVDLPTGKIEPASTNKASRVINGPTENKVTPVLKQSVEEALKKAPDLSNEDRIKLEQVEYDLKKVKDWDTEGLKKAKQAYNGLTEELKSKYGAVTIESPTGKGWKYNIINTKQHLENFKNSMPKETGRQGITLASGLGGLQPLFDKLEKKLSGTQEPADVLSELVKSASAKDTSAKVSAELDRYSAGSPLRSLENIGKEIARTVQVRPQEILKKYAPDWGKKFLKLNNTVVRRQRMLKGRWETSYWDAVNKLTREDRQWIEANFKTVYEKGGAYPNPRVKDFARMWADVSGNVVGLAKDLGVKERYETDKWAVFKGENKRQTRVFASKKEAEDYVRQQVEPDLYTVVDTGEKMTKTRPITARKNYFPHVLTDEAREALQIQNNDVYMALKEACKVRGIDIDAMASEYRPSDLARRYGSLENARMADLPDYVEVKGKKVPILETNPYKVIQQHIERAANRLGIIEIFGQESGAKVFDEFYGNIYKEAQDMHVADQALWMWQKMNGSVRDSFAEGRRSYPVLYSVLGSMENYARAAQLSAATILNAVTGPVPMSVRYGTWRTTKAIFKVGTESIVRRLGVKLPMAEELHKQLRQYAEMGAHSKEAMHVTTGTTDINSRIADTIMRGYGMNAINVFLNKVANHAAHGALLDALADLKGGVRDGGLRKAWGMDKKGLTEFLKREGDFTDADIARMLKDGPAQEDIAGIVQKSSTITNLFEEGGATLPASMGNGWARRLLAYTSWFRMMGATLADSAKYAKEGNYRPLVTMLVGAPLTGFVADAIRDYVSGKVNKDQSFFERLFDLICNSGAIGIAGTVGENVKWAFRTGDAPVTMPLYDWWWQITAGMVKAAGKALEGDTSGASFEAYKTLVKRIPIARIVDNEIGGPYSEYLDDKYRSGRSGRPERKGRLGRSER